SVAEGSGGPCPGPRGPGPSRGRHGRLCHGGSHSLTPWMTPPMKRDLNVCMYTPTSNGGHALYSQELLTALAEVGPDRGVSAELVTCVDLAPENQTDCYPIHRILPPLVPREEFPNRLAWASSRVVYYTRRERAFLDWVAARGGIDVIHFQEYTPWLAPRHCRKLPRRGISLVF